MKLQESGADGSESCAVESFCCGPTPTLGLKALNDRNFFSGTLPESETFASKFDL